MLLVDREYEDAKIVLLLALSDMFTRSIASYFAEAIALTRTLPDSYDRAYYAGIVHERRAKAHHRSHAPGSGQLAYDWFQSAMQLFAEAERLRPSTGCCRRRRRRSRRQPH